MAKYSLKTAILVAMAPLSLTILVNCSANSGTSGRPSATPPLSPTNSILSSPGTLHGTVDSGGGRAVVCRNSAGQLQTVRSLDLYETDHTSRLQPRPSLGTLDLEWKMFADRMSAVWTDPLSRAAELQRVLPLKDQFMNQARFVTEKEARLRPIDDSKEAFTVDGCNIEQIADWLDDETILVQKELWEAMAPRDQAGLIAHEFVYDAYRSLGHRTSVYPRRVVGYVFSTRAILPLQPKLSDFDCVNVKAPSVDNAFMPENGRIGLALTDNGAMKLNFLSYPTQLLLEPLEISLLPIGVQQAIVDCRKNDQLANAVEGESDSVVLTSYFKDHLNVKIDVTCGPQRKVTTSGPEVTLTLKSYKAGDAQVYACRATSPALH